MGAANDSRAWDELHHAHALWHLQQAGTDPIVIKGMAVRHCLYQDDPRAIGDVDVLVAPDGRAELLDRLAQRGLVPAYPGAADAEIAAHSTTLTPSRPNYQLDLHVTFPGVGVPPDDLWTRLQDHTVRVRFGTVDGRMLGRTATCLFGVLHAARNGPTDQKSTEDLRRLADLLTTTDDWREVLGLAKKLDAVGPFVAGLSLLPDADDLLDALGLDRRVGPEWAVRAAGLGSPALRWHELTTLPWRRRVPLLLRELWPTSGFMRVVDPRAAAGPASLLAARARRLSAIARSLPRIRREVRAAVQRDATQSR
jgi:hypothetical protein